MEPPVTPGPVETPEPEFEEGSVVGDDVEGEKYDGGPIPEVGTPPTEEEFVDVPPSEERVDS